MHENDKPEVLTGIRKTEVLLNTSGTKHRAVVASELAERAPITAQNATREGICFLTDADAVRHNFFSRLEELDLLRPVEVKYGKERKSIIVSLRDEYARSWVPQSDTTHLSRNLDLDTDGDTNDLECEIVVAMLASPRRFTYPNYNEFVSAVRIRCNIVRAARRTQLAFHTSAAERPTDYWTYVAGHGFTLQPGKPLIAALERATQPDTSGKLYSFSCYRATEYVVLLGIAQELAHINRPLLESLQKQWETAPIMSAKFHDIFLYEFGSMDDPLPLKYYVPGDRVWFRNPDERSSDISGYEGSWVIYLGGGLFSNFWERDRPYTLTSKCIEIFHWRYGTYLDEAGELRMNEAIVKDYMNNALTASEDVDRIFRRMERLRDPKGVYAAGGCIDASREFPRWVCPGSENIMLGGI